MIPYNSQVKLIDLIEVQRQHRVSPLTCVTRLAHSGTADTVDLTQAMILLQAYYFRFQIWPHFIWYLLCLCLILTVVNLQASYHGPLKKCCFPFFCKARMSSYNILQLAVFVSLTLVPWFSFLVPYWTSLLVSVFVNLRNDYKCWDGNGVWYWIIKCLHSWSVLKDKVLMRLHIS